MNKQVFQKVTENLQPPIQTMQMTQQQADMIQQNTPNEILVNMVKRMTTVLMPIKEFLKINYRKALRR